MTKEQAIDELRKRIADIEAGRIAKPERRQGETDEAYLERIIAEREQEAIQ